MCLFVCVCDKLLVIEVLSFFFYWISWIGIYYYHVCVYQGLDNVHKQRVAEVLSEPEAREKQRSRESLTSDTVKYESGPDGGEEVSMSVEWNGVSTVHSPQHVTESPQNSLYLSWQKPQSDLVLFK